MSAHQPSPRYFELLEQYRDAHENGLLVQGERQPNVFTGKSLKPHIRVISDLLHACDARTLLDYGCGKAVFHKAEQFDLDGETISSLKEFWGLEKVTLFDPGVEAHSQLADGPFDAVISTDVLEHVDEQDVDFVLDQIFSRALKVVYMNISTRPAAKCLPNGENAHVTVRPPEWWKARIEAIAAGRGVAFYCALEDGGQTIEVFRNGC
ncbi:hypothetical protein HAD_08470 [Hyphomonas adhaerens MHS-3]|uniref:Methyltransferase type 11 domain-containing protein n=1 Tax=Hyphomonas adhaerens MHS-3 TaxID=1280949 RepID=A0A069E617_9PROT|nr:class I SAM-dependent methyltransferase [Hyphomonas adhaerens]KCZ85705.1 hypothetical protein HAD_08470 [Hyphomonas adhaerens MHS-3]